MAANDNLNEQLVSAPCADLAFFLSLLHKARKNDDNISHRLNNVNVKSADTCTQLFSTFATGYKQRKQSIQHCLDTQTHVVDTLKLQVEADQGNADLAQRFNSERVKLRLLQTELSAEDIVEDRTIMFFKDRCRNANASIDYNALLR